MAIRESNVAALALFSCCCRNTQLIKRLLLVLCTLKRVTTKAGNAIIAGQQVTVTVYPDMVAKFHTSGSDEETPLVV